MTIDHPLYRFETHGSQNSSSMRSIGLCYLCKVANAELEILQVWDLRNSVSPIKELVGHTKGACPLNLPECWLYSFSLCVMCKLAPELVRLSEGNNVY